MLFAISMLVLTAATAAAADGDGEPDRPRIGLVLGGGGARGAAHIGVLRELERLRIPIDAIAGTSMGAVVGGLYAAGMTPTELEDLVASIDWAAAFRDEADRNNSPFRRKQDDEQFPIRLELGLREGEVQIPLGFIQGQKLGLILRENTLQVAGIDDFDRLPIPFRAVASDIRSGEAYVLSRGDLPTAMRASMAVPGAFAPVVLDGRTLVDGGLVGNVPVSVIREMDVDIVIAVDVEFPLYGAEEIASAIDVTAQMLTILIRKETRRQLATLGEGDFLIRPELGNFGTTNFAEISRAVEPGAEAAAAQSARLSRLALDEAAFEQHLATRRQGLRSLPQVDFLSVVDDGPLSAGFLEDRLKSGTGVPPDAAALSADADRLYGLATFEHVDYRLVEQGEQNGVEFFTRAKSWGPNFLNFGVDLEDDLQGDTAFNLSARMTRRGINRFGAEWRSDLQIGTEPYLKTELYQPLSFDSRLFIAPRIVLEQTNFNAFADQQSIARYRISDSALALDLGRELGLWGELRFGAFVGKGNAKIKVGDPALPESSFDTGGFEARFQVDTRDNAQIPLRGSRVDISFIQSDQGLGADFKFQLLQTEMATAWTRGRHTLNAGLVFNTSFKTDDLVQNFFPLGGFLNLSGLARGEISGPHAGLVRLAYYRRTGETAPNIFDAPLYVGASIEAGDVWQTQSDISVSDVLANGSVFAGVDTFFGPLFIGAGLSEGGDSNFYLSLGRSPL
ncbi:MAG: patatin-like phospholipase family protein [Woeseiaceae bacterium]|nr:patatin-like phospholipase family protein [Woeseiaceae bacterium]